MIRMGWRQGNTLRKDGKIGIEDGKLFTLLIICLVSCVLQTGDLWRTFHIGQVHWETAVSARWKLTHHTNINKLFKLKLVSIYICPYVNVDALFHRCCTFIFPTLPFLIPSPPFHWRCQSCSELYLPSNPSILTFLHLIASPELFWERKGTRKVNRKVSSRSLLNSVYFPQIHLWITLQRCILLTYLLPLHFLNFYKEIT